MKVGDKVKFVTKSTKSVPEYYWESNSNIPSSKTKVDGKSTLGKHYKKHFAKIVDTHNEFFIVEYRDNGNTIIRLGFKKESLKLVKITNWKEEMCG